MYYSIISTKQQLSKEFLIVKFLMLFLYKSYKNFLNAKSLLLLLLTSRMWFATIILVIFFLLIVLYQRKYGKIAPSAVLYLRIRR